MIVHSLHYNLSPLDTDDVFVKNAPLFEFHIREDILCVL